MADIPENGNENLYPDHTRPTYRLRTTSASSRRSDSSRTGSSRLKSPLIMQKSLSNRSDEANNPDILAPKPSRLHIHNSETRRWLGTSEMGSPISSRAVSPEITTLPVSPTRRRQSRSGSFGIARRKISSSSLTSEGGSQKKERRLADIGEVPVENQSVHRREHPEENGAGRRWIKWMHRQNLNEWVTPCAILTSMWVKWAIGLGTYSGHNTPPMYGDYEAQRHWMELTVHLPFGRWYTYDLPYWGLDYPPLTAYISWLCGRIGATIESSWFALDTSRGIETLGSKVFMRTTVLALDTVIYVPALLWFVKTWHTGRSERTQSVALLSLLFNPALLLIDFGHFQYNAVMLGLTICALCAFATDRDSLGALFFVLSLGFKQMALYYAPAIGTYLLAKCLYLGPAKGTRLLIQLGLVTITSFAILFSPFLPPFAPVSAILDPITRIFPFARGLFEDKVANFWCATNVLFKWRNWASSTTLLRLSILCTAVGFLPAVMGMLTTAYKLRTWDNHTTAASTEKTEGKTEESMTPCLQLLPYALLTSSMSFFLFSFQVHEKTILLPLLPISLLLSGASPGSTVYEWGMLVCNVAVFSMWPLLQRDGLGVQYIAALLLWNRLMGYNPLSHRPTSFVHLLGMIVYPLALLLHVLELTVLPPPRLPDLYPVLNVLLCTPIFGLVWLWSIKRGFEVQWALGGLQRRTPTGNDTPYGRSSLAPTPAA